MFLGGGWSSTSSRAGCTCSVGVRSAGSANIPKEPTLGMPTDDSSDIPGEPGATATLANREASPGVFVTSWGIPTDGLPVGSPGIGALRDDSLGIPDEPGAAAKSAN